MKGAFSKIHMIIFLSIFLKIYNQDDESSSKLFLPNTLTLFNGDNVLLASDGIYFYNQTFSQEYTSKRININGDKQILNLVNYAKSVLTQFSEEDGGYIMILAMNIIYFFESDGSLLDSTDLSVYINADYYSLIPYKKSDNCLHYILSQKNPEFDFTINHFKFNINSHNNELILSKRVSVSINQEWPNLSAITGPSCLFLSISSFDHNLLVCFYALNQPYEIQSKTFDPSNDFEELTQFFKYYIDDLKAGFPLYLTALTNNLRIKAFIFLVRGDSCAYSLIFDLENLFYLHKKEDIVCEIEPQYYRIKFAYFQSSESFIFIGVRWGANPPIPIMTLNNNFDERKISNFLPENVYGINSCSSFYDGSNYILVYDDANSENSNNIFLGGITLTPVEASSVQTTEVETSSPQTNAAETTEVETSSPQTNAVETTEISFVKNIKCKEASLESSYYDLCTECDNDKGYYEAEFDSNSFLHGFLECYNEETKPVNFYFDNLKFKACYSTCKSCSTGGNENSHNCRECENNYIKEPIEDSTNCVLACKYFYYYTFYGQYKCTSGNFCPEEAHIYIKELNKCTNDCSKEEDYIFEYDGKCLINCPENTSPNDNNKCIDDDIHLCSKTEKEIKNQEELDMNELDLYGKNYAKDFSYTLKHVSHFHNNVYSILLYKDLYCIEELSINMPKIDFGDCYTKVRDILYLSEDDAIIIALIEKFGNQRKSSTTYFFYHPITGEKIDAATICADTQIEIKESVLSQLNNTNINLEAALFMTQQNIDIFNLSHEFYTDICFHYKSPNGKDIPLKDRIKTFFPNISLCNEGCETRGVNLTTMESICECKFNNILNLGGNPLMQSAFGEITNLLSSSNIMVLKCYKDLFQKKYFKLNTGGFIIIGITAVEISFAAMFYILDQIKIFQYIYNLAKNFVKFTKKKMENREIDENILTINVGNAPPKRDENIKYKEKARRIKTKNFKIISNNDYAKDTFNTQKSDNELTRKKKLAQRTTIRTENSDEVGNFNFQKAIQDFSPKIKNSKNLDKYIDMEDYLKTDLDDMDYDDALINDKRKFCEFYWERLKNKQMILNIFLRKEFLKPRTIKIILLLLNIELYFVVNGLFYNEEYISDLFNSNEKETFFSFFSRSIERFLYSTIVGVFIESLIGFIFIEEKKIKKILIREKNNFEKLKYEIFKVMKSIKIRYIIFTIVFSLISIISWYYVNCFNNVYPGIKLEWIKSSITIITIMQLLPIFTALIQTIFRFLSFKWKSEKLFELQIYFS